MIDLIVSIIGITSGVTAMIFSKSMFDKKATKSEEKEIFDDVENTIAKFVGEASQSKNDDVLALMIKNIGELREYYVMNKQHARKAFSAALFISFLGFILFVAGFVISYIENTPNIIQYSTVSGSIVEIISGLFFFLHSKSTKQINIFYRSLLDTEKFLTAIQLVDKISHDKKDDSYIKIIEKILEININNSLQKNNNDI